MLSPRGSRWITTFKKLPNKSPSSTAKTIRKIGGNSASEGKDGMLDGLHRDRNARGARFLPGRPATATSRASLKGKLARAALGAERRRGRARRMPEIEIAQAEPRREALLDTGEELAIERRQQTFGREIVNALERARDE